MTCLLSLLCVQTAMAELTVSPKILERAPEGVLLSVLVTRATPHQKLGLYTLPAKKLMGIGFVNSNGVLQFPSVLIAYKSMEHFENGRYRLHLLVTDNKSENRIITLPMI